SQRHRDRRLGAADPRPARRVPRHRRHRRAGRTERAADPGRHATQRRAPPRHQAHPHYHPPHQGTTLMTFDLGVYSFGNTPPTADGGPGNTAQAIRNVLEAVQVAEEVGLDFFGFGEHHTRSMPLSSPTSLVNAAAASTQRIGLGTTVSGLSTDEPIRVFHPL